MVLSFTAGSPNQKASFESNNSNPFKRVVILINHPVAPPRSASAIADYVWQKARLNVIKKKAAGLASGPSQAEKNPRRAMPY